MGPRKEEPPTEIPTVIPETDSEDEIIVVDEIPPKDDLGLAKPSASGLIPPPHSPQASNCDKIDVQITPSQKPGANDLLNPFTTEPLAISLLLETDNLGIIH